jgi:hypothetical protein
VDLFYVARHTNQFADLASKTGVTPEQAQQGMGAVLSALKSTFPEEAFEKVRSAVPDSEEAIAQAESAGAGATGGIMEAVENMAGKVLGGGGAAAELASKLSQLGLSPEQIKNFLPKAIEFIKVKLSRDRRKAQRPDPHGGGCEDQGLTLAKAQRRKGRREERDGETPRKHTAFLFAPFSFASSRRCKTK